MPNRFRLVVIALCGLALACTERNPAGPPPTTPPFFVAGGQGTGKTSLDLVEDDYANGLLDKNNANRYRQYAVSAPEKLPPKYKSDAIGKDATYSMLQMALEWDELSRSTQQEILDLRANGFGQLKETLETEHFVLHYTTQGAHAVAAVDNNGNSISDFIDVAAESYERIWQREVVDLRYPAPKGTPGQKFHVYFQNLRLYYGYTVGQNVETLATSPFPLGTATAYIVVENDFAEGFPPNDEDVTGNEPVRSGAQKVTNAHEFMHAIQFNINIYQSGWLFESHATWAEDAVYDGINDWHWYINRFLRTPDFPIFNRFVYGSAFFMNYLSETYGVDVPRQIWFAARTSSTPNAVREAAFGPSWEEMKRFGPAEYLLGISDFTNDPPSVPSQIRPIVNFIRATHTSYPVDVDVPPSKGNFVNRAPWGLGANFVEFVATVSGTLTITFDGADGFEWRAYAVATAANGRSSTIPITVDAASDAGSIAIPNFGTRWAKVTLVPTIAGREGVAVPYAYGATVN